MNVWGFEVRFPGGRLCAGRAEFKPCSWLFPGCGSSDSRPSNRTRLTIMNNLQSILSRLHAVGLAFFCAVLLSFTGCGSKDADTQTPAPSRVTKQAAAQTEPVMLDTGGAPQGSQDDAALLQSLLGAGEDDPEPKTEADKAWAEVKQALQPPRPPIEWMTNRPSDKDIAEFEKQSAALAFQAAEKVRNFYTKYPDHRRAETARAQEPDLLTAAAESGNTNALARLQALEEARLKDPSLSAEERLSLRVQQLQRTAQMASRANVTNALTGFEQGVRSLLKEFPERPELSGLLMAAAQNWMDHDPARSRTLAQEVSKSDVPQELKESAATLLKTLERLGKPVPIQFTAIDGRAVDLAQMKGKVVLVDFWATWCNPCMAELPNVKAAYEKLHPRGFEIVGISLDREKAALEEVVKDQQIPWPQHFDDKNESNRLAEEFGIASVPTMWLVDKQGNLRDLSARENLAEKVERLLADK